MQADADLTRNPRPPSSVDRMIALFTRNSILRMTDVHQYMNIRHFEELMRIFQEGKREDASGFDIDKVGSCRVAEAALLCGCAPNANN